MPVKTRKHLSAYNLGFSYALMVFCVLAGLSFTCVSAKAQNIINVKNERTSVSKGDVSYFPDTSQQLKAQDLAAFEKFRTSEQAIINFYKTKSTNFWFHLRITNHSENETLLLNIDYALLNKVVLYRIKNGIVTDTAVDGLSVSFKEKKYDYQNPLFNLALQNNDTCDYLLKVESQFPVFLPLKIISYDQFTNEISSKDAVTGIYTGIFLALFLYNIFILFTVKDRSYYYYIIYILFMGLTQLTLLGYTPRFLWADHPGWTNYAIIIFPGFAGIASIGFANGFMEVKKYYPRLQKVFSLFIFLYIIAAILAFFGLFYYSYRIIDTNASLLGSYGLLLSILITRKGSRAAKFWLTSWAILIVCLALFLLRNFGVLPYNTFTGYMLYIGSAIQAILLSIALADRINIYKIENEKSQAFALKISRENETLIREQNIVLEEEVTRRTEELLNTNSQLGDALHNLKETQSQLVDAEKMASLGQLTAGIAHEINNPINFVKSNINPLRLDIAELIELLDEYQKLHTLANSADTTRYLKEIEQQAKNIDIAFVKSEIQDLFKGIEEGADRTAEIVRGLRTFSRLDETALKIADVHDGIQSTIVLLRNSIPYYVSINVDLIAKGIIECYPGKLNQVFMNIINNAIQAILAKKEKDETEYIEISTRDIDDDKIEITIKDSGTGMTEEVKHKIFEPFFTTKEVGEGMGLGMAIVFRIIKMHEGSITIISEPGKGAEFVLTLPYRQPETEKS